MTFLFSQLEQVLNTWHIRPQKTQYRTPRGGDLSHPLAIRTWPHDIGPVPSIQTELFSNKVGKMVFSSFEKKDRSANFYASEIVFSVKVL
jgi:hypothetical protein